MRRLSPTTSLVLASLVGAGKAASNDFYFNSTNWQQVLDQYGYAIGNAVPQGADTKTSIIDPNKVSDKLQFLFVQDVASAAFQNALLVNADTHETLAVGYDVGPDGTGQKNTSIITPQFPVSWKSDGSLTLDTALVKQVLSNQDPAVLFFQVGWQTGTGDEYGSSPAWAVAPDGVAASALYTSLSQKSPSTVLELSSSPTAFFAPTTTPLVPVTAGSSATATAGMSTEATSSATSTSTSTAKTGSTATQAKSSSSHPLSTGALVGIIIGCIAFLALLLLAAFFCIRKRRQRAKTQRALLDRDTQDLMTEKEARAAGTAPDTPYSEEGVHNNNNLRGASFGEGVGVGVLGGGGSAREGAAAGGEASQRGSVVYSSLRNVTTVGSSGVGTAAGPGPSPSPTDTHPSAASLHDSESRYSPQPEDQQEHHHRPPSAADLVSPQSDDAAEEDDDTERSPLAPPPPAGQEETRARARAGSGASGSGAATPGGGSSARFAGRADTPGAKSISDYLHEDGMTADEIRRFEEEERALDEAIEQAGRTNSRPAEGR